MRGSIGRRQFLMTTAAMGALAALNPHLAVAADGALGPLIPRRVLFGLPDREQPRISPDGRLIAWIAPHKGARNIWVAPADDPKSARPVTELAGRGVAQLVPHRWAMDSRHVIFGQDEGGNENFRLSSVNVETGAIVSLTPAQGVRAAVVQDSRDFPEMVLVSHNGRDRRFFDAYRVNVRTGQSERVFDNDGYVNFWADHKLTVRLASRRRPDGGLDYFDRRADGTWKPMATIGFQDMQTTAPLMFAADNATTYWRDSRGRDKAALVALGPDGSIQVLGQDDRADVDAVEFDPVTKKPLGWRVTFERPEWESLDDRFKEDLFQLRNVDSGDVNFMNWSEDGQRAVVWFNHDDGPATFWLYDRTARKATFLFNSRDNLKNLPLVPMRPVVIKSRDGLDLVSYLSVPRGAKGPVPLVLLVHGGPWSRDNWGFVPSHQWLTNRGYAVLSVNFRASIGFGKSFINASNGEWGAKMHEDLLDAVDWAVREGIADRGKVAIMGGSYGGYATLVGMTFTPDVFACGVASVAVSNLITFLDTIPPYWRPNAAMWHQRLGGDPATKEGRDFLVSRSPITFVDRIKRPLLLGHGANDPRVVQAESDQVVAAAQKKGIPVVYAVFPDEGHGFHRPANRFAYWALVEAFLATHLGGRFEPVGRDFEGSSIEIRAGRDLVPGLAG